MKVIKTLNDIYRLEKQKIIPTAFSQQLQSDFKHKAREAIFPSQIPEPDFEIDEYGYMVILEPDDMKNHLPEEGLKVYFGTEPDFAEIFAVDGTPYYRIVQMADNDYIMYYYSQVGIHSATIEEQFQNLLGGNNDDRS